MNLKEFAELKEKVDSLQRQEDKITGALEREKQEMKKELKCNSIKEAETALKKLKQEEVLAEKEYSEAMKEFENKWKDKLEESDNG